MNVIEDSEGPDTPSHALYGAALWLSYVAKYVAISVEEAAKLSIEISHRADAVK